VIHSFVRSFILQAISAALGRWRRRQQQQPGAWILQLKLAGDSPGISRTWRQVSFLNPELDWFLHVLPANHSAKSL
jgi:hypothetical protein